MIKSELDPERKLRAYLQPLTQRIFVLTKKTPLFKKLDEQLKAKKDFVTQEKYEGMNHKLVFGFI